MAAPVGLIKQVFFTWAALCSKSRAQPNSSTHLFSYAVQLGGGSRGNASFTSLRLLHAPGNHSLAMAITMPYLVRFMRSACDSKSKHMRAPHKNAPLRGCLQGRILQPLTLVVDVRACALGEVTRGQDVLAAASALFYA